MKFAGLNWESAAFLTELLRLVAEKGYDCQTEAIPGNTVTMEAALATNDIQVIAEEWIGRSEAWNNAFQAGKVKALGHSIVGASEGWYVPDYVIKGDPKHGIKPLAPKLKTVADLPQYKSVFQDPEEPAKGRFLNCPTGWSCEGVNSQQLKAYKLTDSYVNFRPGTGAALDAEIASSYQRGKPVLFYYWAPTALFGKYKFVQIQEPAYNEACFKTLADKDNANPCGSARPGATIQVGVSRALNDSDPALVALFSNFNVPIERLNKALADQAERKTEWPALAREFVRQHPEVVRKWVPADVARKVAAAAG